MRPPRLVVSSFPRCLASLIALFGPYELCSVPARRPEMAVPL